MARFSDDQIERYSRHILLREVGGVGQDKLLRARVLVVGCGGLGSPAALYLAAAGVGVLGLADHDAVDLSNLQRQILHGTSSVGHAKTESARARLEELNPDTQIVTHPVRLTASNILDVIKGYDLVLDGTDNFPSRYLINDACVKAGIPLVHAGILRFQGQVTFVHPGGRPCYRCLYPEPPPEDETVTCSRAGVLGAVAGTIGALQATEALKAILNIGELLTGRLLVYDALKPDFRIVRYVPDPECPLCSGDPARFELTDLPQHCSSI